MDEDDFTFEEDDTEDIPILLVYGEKGVGKTDLLLGMKGDKETIAVVSMDHKSKRVAKGRYGDEPGIRVYDGVRYMRYDEGHFIPTAERTYSWLLFLLKNIRLKVKPDWVLLDGLEKLIEVCEMKMRGKHSLKPHQNFANLNLWKDRKMFLRAIHDEMKRTARKGVLYTTYTKNDEIVEQGTLIKKAKIPAWIDIIMEETDVVFHAETLMVGKKLEFQVLATTSKLPWVPVGWRAIVTGKKLCQLLKIPKMTFKLGNVGKSGKLKGAMEPLVTKARKAFL